ncbi:MAG TPA: YdcF family protein [Rhizobiales bacterium]|nr:YdcF family protein [Hyphomicrobiales bacterium]
MTGQDQIIGPTGGGEECTAKAGSRRRRSAVAAALVTALIALFGFAGGFAWFASHVSGLATPADPGNADAIIVLTGGQSRLGAAFDLLESGKGRRLLISGVNPAARDEDIRAAAGAGKELFSCCVDIDHAALDTIGNAEEGAKWAANHDFDRIIVVTNNYHMPRSLLEMRRYLADTELVPYPVVNTPLGNGGWMTKPDALRVLFTEYTKYVAALVRGVVPRRSADESVSLAKAADR